MSNRDDKSKGFLDRLLAGAAPDAKDKLIFLSTFPAGLSQLARPIYRKVRQDIPKQCVEKVCSAPAFSNLPKKTVEACLVGLWALDEFHNTDDKNIALAASTTARRKSMVPKGGDFSGRNSLRNVMPLERRLKKLIHIRDYWMTAKGRDQMQAMLILGMLRRAGWDKISVHTLRQLYPIIYPFLTVGKHHLVSSRDFKFTFEQKNGKPMSSDRDQIYRQIRMRVAEITKTMGGREQAFALGDQLLKSVQATIQRIP